MGCSRARAILLVHLVMPRELQPSPRAQDQLGWTTSDGAPRKSLTGASITFWVLGRFAQWGPVRGCFGRSSSLSRHGRAHSEALGSDPLSRGTGSTHSSRRRLSWLDTAVAVSPRGHRRAWWHCPGHQCGASQAKSQRDNERETDAIRMTTCTEE